MTAPMDPEVTALSESLVDELVGAVGLPKTPFWHRLFRGVSRRATGSLAALGMGFDRRIASEGLPAASAWALTDFCSSICARGTENIPLEGPLLVTSNHPGAYDGLVIFSQLIRKDVIWIGSEIPFLAKLPNTREHMLFASRSDILNRMTVTRAAIRHLNRGGALVYFGAGHREPDPAVYPGAGKMLAQWLQGISFFFKHVPGLQLLPTVVSGVVSARWAHHPISRLRRKQIDQQRLSEFGQVITQLLAPGKFKLTPNISFGQALPARLLSNHSGDGELLASVIAREKIQLVEHCQAFGGDPGL